MITENQLQPDHPAAPPNTTLAFDRLLGLAQHLESPDERHHTKFDFCVVAMWATKQPGCGTVGCAVGELPYCFPEFFQFNGAGMHRDSNDDPIVFRGADAQAVALKPLNDADAPVDEIVRAGIFFGLTMEETNHLFVPNNQNTEQFGGRYLGIDATAQQVAQNIRCFLRTIYPDQYNAQLPRPDTSATQGLPNAPRGLTVATR